MWCFLEMTVALSVIVAGETPERWLELDPLIRHRKDCTSFALDRLSPTTTVKFPYIPKSTHYLTHVTLLISDYAVHAEMDTSRASTTFQPSSSFSPQS